MDGNNQRPRGDSSMRSHAPNKQSSSTPLRVAVARPENQEFNIAGEDFGGLPLDKAVKDSFKSGKKDPEPINQLLKNLEYHVDVPLKKSTKTVFSSMGGGRNISSTEIGWGGPYDNKAKYDTPKDFVYREEDFPPPSSANDSSSSGPSASKPKKSAFSPSKGFLSNSKKSSPAAEPHDNKAAPYLGLNHSFFRMAPGNKDDKPSMDGTSNMNLGIPLLKNSATPLQQRKQPQPNQNETPYKKPSSGTDTPEMGLDMLSLEDSSSKATVSAHHAPSHEPFNALPHLTRPTSEQAHADRGTPEMNLDKFFSEEQLPSSQSKKKPSPPLRSTPTRQDTPEMNLNSLFSEDQPISPLKDHLTSVRVSHGIAQPLLGESSKPVSISLEDLLDDSDASDQSPYDSPADTKATSSHGATHGEPTTHPVQKDAHAPSHSAAGKNKLPSMPNHTAMPSISMQFFSAKKASVPAQRELPSVSVPQPPSVSAPLISVPKLSTLKAPSVSGHESLTPSAPLVIVPILPSLSQPSVSALELPSAPRLHTVDAPHLGGIRGVMPPRSSMSSSSRHPPLLPEEEADFPRGDAPRLENPPPSNVREAIEVQKVPAKPHPVAVLRADAPKGEKKLGKRARKAQRKHDATQRHSIMETISTALVGRKKNSVSSPVMKLNELFDEPMAMALPATATPTAPLLEGIRGRLPSVTMPSLSSVHMPTMPAVPSVHMPSMPAIPALPSVHLPALPEVHMPDLALPHLPKLGSTAVHDVSSVATKLSKHKPSTAVALKMPKIDATLLPEEQANYPRGDSRRHENPVPSHVQDRADVKELILPGAISSLSVLPVWKLGSLTTHNVAAKPIILSKHKSSKAAAIKAPKVDITLLPEEQANYPRGDIRRRENPAPSHVEDIVEVKKLHLEDLPVLKLGSAAVHGVSSVTVPLRRHKPSKAAAIKMPKVDLTLFPEEQANYPRGDIQRRENPTPSHVEDIVEVKELRLPAPLPLDAELPVIATAAAALSMPSIHMPTLPSVHLPSLPSVSLPSVKLPTMPEVHLPEVHMPTLPAMPAMPTLHMPTLPKITIPDFKSLLDEDENYYSADDELASPIVTRKPVVTEPARVIPKIAASAPVPTEVVVPVVTQKTTTVVTEPAARVIPKIAAVAVPIAAAVPIITQKTGVTESTRVVPEIKKIPIAQPPVEVKKIPIAQPPVEVKKIPIAQPPVEVRKPRIRQAPVQVQKIPAAQAPVQVQRIPAAQAPIEVQKIHAAQTPVEIKKIPIAQPPVVTKTTTVKTTAAAAPASVASKIEVTKPVVQEIKEVKEVKVMTAPKPEPNVRKPSAAELYANEHRHTTIIEPKVDDSKLTEKITHAPRPVIPAVIETKKLVVKTHAPKIVDAPKPIVVETHKVVEAPKIVMAASAAPIPAPRPEPIITMTTVTTTKTAGPIPGPRPVVAAAVTAAAIAPVFHHQHKEAVAPAPVHMEEKKQETTKIAETVAVEPAPQPVQQIKKVVEEVHHNEPIPQPVHQVQQAKTVVEERHHQPQPQIQQQQIIQQQSLATAPVETLINSGERTMLVKKLYTTTEYYDSEDEDELDEYGYRKDRDVSLHIGPMPTAETRRRSLQAYRERKNSGISSLDADIATLRRQETMNSRGPSLAEPLQQQHPHFYEQTPQVVNRQPYTMQIPLHDASQQQQQYQVVQQHVYNTQPRGQQQQQKDLSYHQQPQQIQQTLQQQQPHSTQPHVQQQQQQQYNKQQPQSLQQQQQQQHPSQNQPINQSKLAYQQSQPKEQMQMQQQQPGIRVGGEYNRGPTQ